MIDFGELVRKRLTENYFVNKGQTEKKMYVIER